MISSRLRPRLETSILNFMKHYFLLANLVTRFIYLRIGLAIILCFVGLKMLTEPWVHMPSWISLLIIAAILARLDLLAPLL